jgi:hypothetical protein
LEREIRLLLLLLGTSVFTVAWLAGFGERWNRRHLVLHWRLRKLQHVFVIEEVVQTSTHES